MCHTLRQVEMMGQKFLEDYLCVSSVLGFLQQILTLHDDYHMCKRHQEQEENCHPKHEPNEHLWDIVRG